MGKTSPTQKTTVKKQSSAKEPKSSDQVLPMVGRLSELLLAYRTREGLDLKEMAERMGIGQSRYNEIEKNRNLNPDFGVSLAFLQRFADLEKKTLSALAASIQGQAPSGASKRQQIDDEFLSTFSRVKLDDRLDLIAAGKKKSEVEAIPDRIKWLVDLGLDLFSMDVRDQLEFEVRIHHLLLKEKHKSRITNEARRDRLTLILRKIIDLS